MSDERELKLECYRAAGSIDEAQRLYDWVTGGDYQVAGSAIDIALKGMATWAPELREKVFAALRDKPPAAVPPSELRSVTPATEEESGDQLLTAFEDDHIVERGPLIDQQTCDEVDPRCSWDKPELDSLAEFMQRPGAVKWGGGVYGDFVKQNPDLNYTETEIEVLFSDGRTFTGLSGGFLWNHTFESDDIIAYRILSEPSASEETLPVDPLPGFDEADAESDALGDDPTAVAIAAYIEAENAEPASVLNDPELQADVERKKEMLAQDEPTPEYVGCIDEELEREYDAAKARTTIQHEDAKKPFFAFLGAKPKHETEDA